MIEKNKIWLGIVILPYFISLPILLEIVVF